MSEKRINQALEILKESGYKYTKRREEILSFLEKEDKYIAPKEVYDLCLRSMQELVMIPFIAI